MIIVLKNANFSQTNIGTVEIPTKRVKSVVINGNSEVTGKRATFTLTATYNDQTTEDVSSKANWNVDNDCVSISGGVLTISPGADEDAVVITASYGGKSVSKNVVVTYSPVSEETLALLQNYGGTYTDAQKIAVEDFLEGYSLSSWANKVKYMIVPILCPQAELNTTLLVQQSMAFYDIVSKKIISPTLDTYSSSYAYFSIGNNGLRKNQVASNAGNFLCYVGLSSLGLQITNCTAVRWDIVDAKASSFVDEAGPCIGQYSINGTKHGFTMGGYNGAFIGGLTVSDQQAGTVKGISYDKARGVRYGNVDGAAVAPSVSFNDVSGSITQLKLFQRNSGKLLEIGFWAVCEFMEQAELNDFCSLVKTLTNALKES